MGLAPPPLGNPGSATAMYFFLNIYSKIALMDLASKGQNEMFATAFDGLLFLLTFYIQGAGHGVAAVLCIPFFWCVSKNVYGRCIVPSKFEKGHLCEHLKLPVQRNVNQFDHMYQILN